MTAPRTGRAQRRAWLSSIQLARAQLANGGATCRAVAGDVVGGVGGWQGLVAADAVGDFFRQNQRWGVEVAGGDHWKQRGIDHTQPFQAMDPTLAIDEDRKSVV